MLAIYGWACQCDLSCEILFSFSFVPAFRNFFVSIFVSVNGIKIFSLTDISVSVE